MKNSVTWGDRARRSFGDAPIYLGFFLLSHWIGLIPMVVRGSWVNYLIPSDAWLTVCPHLMVMVALAILFGPRLWMLAVVPPVTILFALFMNWGSIAILLKETNGDYVRAVGPIAWAWFYILLSGAAFILLTTRIDQVRSWSRKSHG